MLTKETIIQHLELIPHPEGGWYRELYRSHLQINTKGQQKIASTQIYYLMAGDAFSHLHRLSSDEIWNFHLGDPVLIHILKKPDQLITHKVGLNFDNKELPCVAIEANHWFAAESTNKKYGFSLVSCNVAPGFDFSDFQLGDYEQLTKMFPNQAEFIKKFALAKL